MDDLLAIFTNYTTSADFDMFKTSTMFILDSLIGNWLQGSTPLRDLPIIVGMDGTNLKSIV